MRKGGSSLAWQVSNIGPELMPTKTIPLPGISYLCKFMQAQAAATGGVRQFFGPHAESAKVCNTVLEHIHTLRQLLQISAMQPLCNMSRGHQ
jgi:hypothetical protein